MFCTSSDQCQARTRRLAATRFALLRNGLLLCLVAAQVACASRTTLVGFARDGQKASPEGIVISRRGAPVQPSPGMALEAGDEVRTTAVSAVIKFPDNTWVIVAPNSAVSIGSLGITRGTIFAKARRLFQVETQFVRVTVEGTEYQVTVDENNQASVDVAEGQTRLTSTRGSWEAVVVLGSEGAVVKAEEVPRKRPLSPEEVKKIRQQ